MNTIHLKGLMPIENFDHDRDATGPAENAIGTKEENMNRSIWDIPVSPEPDNREDPVWMPRLDWGNTRIHAGKLYLAGLAHDLPARLVKRIDRFALKVLRSPVRRYCV